MREDIKRKVLIHLLGESGCLMRVECASFFLIMSVCLCMWERQILHVCNLCILLNPWQAILETHLEDDGTDLAETGSGCLLPPDADFERGSDLTRPFKVRVPRHRASSYVKVPPKKYSLLFYAQHAVWQATREFPKGISQSSAALSQSSSLRVTWRTGYAQIVSSVTCLQNLYSVCVQRVANLKWTLFTWLQPDICTEDCLLMRSAWNAA